MKYPLNRRQFAQTLAFGAATAAMGQALAKPSNERLPNIIFVLADDLGWAELGCQGNAFNETPRLDRLADEGVRFTQAYAAAPVCSPYRAALMSGQWPARVGINDYLRPNDPKHLPTEITSLPEALKGAGYATGMIGKWHLTGYKNHGAKEFPPTVQGFDEAIVSENRGIGGGSYFHPYHFNREIERRLPEREHLVDRMNVEAVDFIKRHRDHPFFLFVSHYAVHTRLNGRPDLLEKYRVKPGCGRGPNGDTKGDDKATHNNPHLAAQLELIDEGVGMIADTLDELGLTGDTVLIFTSDNGGQDSVTSNAPLREGKSTLYEGGVREPLIVRWPGVTPRGAVCDTPTCNIDFMPTFLEAAGVSAPKGQIADGVSIAPLLRDPAATLKRDTFYWHYPLDRPHFLGGRSTGSIRRGDWKLIEYFDTGEHELYDLSMDIGEANDLAASNKKKADELQQALKKWRKEVGATIPDNCANYDPEKRKGKPKPKAKAKKK